MKKQSTKKPAAAAEAPDQTPAAVVMTGPNEITIDGEKSKLTDLLGKVERGAEIAAAITTNHHALTAHGAQAHGRRKLFLDQSKNLIGGTVQAMTAAAREVEAGKAALAKALETMGGGLAAMHEAAGSLGASINDAHTDAMKDEAERKKEFFAKQIAELEKQKAALG